MSKKDSHLRRYIYAETDGACIYCGRPFAPENLSMDHIVPQKGNGGKNKDNLVCCCTECNGNKGSLTVREFTAMMPDRQRNGYLNRVCQLYHSGYISLEKKELLLGRSAREPHRRRLHLSTLLFDIHLELLIRRRS